MDQPSEAQTPYWDAAIAYLKDKGLPLNGENMSSAMQQMYRNDGLFKQYSGSSSDAGTDTTSSAVDKSIDSIERKPLNTPAIAKADTGTSPVDSKVANLEDAVDGGADEATENGASSRTPVTAVDVPEAKAGGENGGTDSASLRDGGDTLGDITKVIAPVVGTVLLSMLARRHLTGKATMSATERAATDSKPAGVASAVADAEAGPTPPGKRPSTKELAQKVQGKGMPSSDTLMNTIDQTLGEGGVGSLSDSDAALLQSLMKRSGAATTVGRGVNTR
jgi:hypothetical protein